jgi:hypothetical protein
MPTAAKWALAFTNLPKTGFMAFGDRVRMEALSPNGDSPFGVIAQAVVEHQSQAASSKLARA